MDSVCPTPTSTIFALLLLTILSIHVHGSLSSPSSTVADVIIVGGGTAGCALAARLCIARPDLSLVLLERGTPPNATQSFVRRSPREMWTAWRTELITELFRTEPDNYTFNRPHEVITGNTLGGTSAINARQFVIPLRGTVERWGIKGLSTDSARKYYTRVYRTVGFQKQRDNKMTRKRLGRQWVKGGNRAGYPMNDDPFDDRSLYSTIESKLSVSPEGFNVNSCDAYVTSEVKNMCSNLRVRQGITVSKILLSKMSKKSKKSIGGKFRATGVEYIRTVDSRKLPARLRKRYKLHASRMVLSCAGPYGSPKLLQLSGIGPKSVLSKAGVHQKINLPVGQHTLARSVYSIFTSYTSPLEPSNNSTLLNSPSTRRRWERGNGGVLGTAPASTNGRIGRDGYMAGIGAFFGPLLNQKLFQLGCLGNVDPQSTGYLRIKSNDPFESPRVSLALLKSQADVSRIVRVAKALKRIAKSMPKENGITVLPPNEDEIEVTERVVREQVGHPGHFVAGCRVGDVLHSDFRVRGVNGLRVIDASALSHIPTSSGPMASVYMIAEYAAEMLAKDIKSK